MFVAQDRWEYLLAVGVALVGGLLVIVLAVMNGYVAVVVVAVTVVVIVAVAVVLVVTVVVVVAVVLSTQEEAITNPSQVIQGLSMSAPPTQTTVAVVLVPATEALQQQEVVHPEAVQRTVRLPPRSPVPTLPTAQPKAQVAPATPHAHSSSEPAVLKYSPLRPPHPQ